jgi:hypothetical protein
MFNLFVSGDSEAWQGKPWQIEKARCVREYTDDALTERFGGLDEQAVAVLKRLPCIFAYEKAHRQAPLFGRIRDVMRRQGDEIRVEYQIEPVNPFLTADDLQELSPPLDIGKLELNRTHWAVKEVNLLRELATKGIVLPGWSSRRGVNIETHQFDVALSFSGSERELVEQIGEELERRLGPDRYFYDHNYAGQLARPGMDILLQDIYRARSRLVVVFIGAQYQARDWCGIEFRAIRDIINRREHKRVMYIKTGEGDVEGVLPNDGYVDARHFSPSNLAGFIEERLDFI